jgi:anti-sigma factor RsiW
VRGHADAATLAAFREELLSARKAAQVSAHLAACPRCAALEAQLAEVTTLLSRATAPPMPDALTARIQAALAAEAAARATDAAPLAAAAAATPPAVTGTAGHNGMPGANGRDRAGNTAGRRTGWRGRDRSWLALRVAAVTAAVAVIAGGGYGVAQLLTAGNSAVNGAAPGTAAAPNFKVKGPVPGLSAGGLNAPASSSGAGSSATTLAPLVVSSGTNYQPTSLGAQASAVLAHLTHKAHSSPIPGPALAPQQKQASLFPDLQACLIHIGNGRRPLLVDLAHYLGHPALIVVLPSRNGAQPHALAIAPGCTGATAHVLATATLPSSG